MTLDNKGQDASPVVFTTPLNTTTSTHHLDWKPFPDTSCMMVCICQLLEVEINSVSKSKPMKYLLLIRIVYGYPYVANLPAGRSRAAVVAVATNKIICIGGDMALTANQEYSKIYMDRRT